MKLGHGSSQWLHFRIQGNRRARIRIRRRTYSGECAELFLECDWPTWRLAALSIIQSNPIKFKSNNRFCWAMVPSASLAIFQEVHHLVSLAINRWHWRAPFAAKERRGGVGVGYCYPWADWDYCWSWFLGCNRRVGCGNRIDSDTGVGSDSCACGKTPRDRHRCPCPRRSSPPSCPD